MAAHQGPTSLGFSRQEYWSGLPLSSPFSQYTYLLLLHSAAFLGGHPCPDNCLAQPPAAPDTQPPCSALSLLSVANKCWRKGRDSPGFSVECFSYAGRKGEKVRLVSPSPLSVWDMKVNIIIHAGAMHFKSDTALRWYCGVTAACVAQL